MGGKGQFLGYCRAMNLTLSNLDAQTCFRQWDKALTLHPFLHIDEASVQSVVLHKDF